MIDLDHLRPEVREAIAYCDGIFDDADNGEWAIIRAELLQLATRNAELEAKATRDHDWISDLLAENKKAEAELAALKARIAEAPVGVFGLCYNGHEPGFLGFPRAINNLPRESMLGKRVRLVVEE